MSDSFASLICSCSVAENESDKNAKGDYTILSGASAAAGKLSYRNLMFGSQGMGGGRPFSEKARALDSVFSTFDKVTGEPEPGYKDSSMFQMGGQKGITNRVEVRAEVPRSADESDKGGGRFRGYTFVVALPLSYLSTLLTRRNYLSIIPNVCHQCLGPLDPRSAFVQPTPVFLRLFRKTRAFEELFNGVEVLEVKKKGPEAWDEDDKEKKLVVSDVFKR